MSDFSPDVLLEIARTADTKLGKMSDIPVVNSVGTFSQQDLDNIEDFKNAIFMVLMLRARQYMVMTRQENLSNESWRHAYARFGITFISKDIHPDSDVDASKIMNLADGDDSGDDFTVMGPIPRKTDRSIFDTAVTTEILNDFDRFALALACPN